MFWSGNYITAKEITCLLKGENVTLKQVLEADDILHECRAENKLLTVFLKRPQILEELVSLVIEEPAQDVELQSQYRHAYMACEVLTSHVAMLSDQLASDMVQMNRLCDFINRDPPLNPLLASFFSKTVMMLLEKRQQDWYLYQMVVLKVVEIFRGRREFLPNLLRHISTSAIVDIFDYFTQIEDPFLEVFVEWLEEHQLIESLIQILCGTYIPEELQSCGVTKDGNLGLQNDKEATDSTEPTPEGARAMSNHQDTEAKEDIQGAPLPSTEKDLVASDQHTAGSERETAASEQSTVANEEDRAAVVYNEEIRAARMRAIASNNAASLLCNIIRTYRGRVGPLLLERFQVPVLVEKLLQSIFTSPPQFRRHALVHGCTVLCTLLCSEFHRNFKSKIDVAIAPHLPLLHQALLQAPEHRVPGGIYPRVGAERVHVAELVAELAGSTTQEVATTLITLGTLNTLVELMFAHPHNNFLHAAVYHAITNSLENMSHRLFYATHLLLECDLLTKVMNAFQEKDLQQTSVRRGYMGHLVMLGELLGHAVTKFNEAGGSLPAGMQTRWEVFHEELLEPLLIRYWEPLGGCLPSDTSYAYGMGFQNAAIDGSEDVAEDEVVKMANSFVTSLNFNRMWPGDDASGTVAGGTAGAAGGGGEDVDPEVQVQQVLEAVAPWEENGTNDGDNEGEGWAQFISDTSDPFASHDHDPFPSDTFSNINDVYGDSIDGVDQSTDQLGDRSDCQYCDNFNHTNAKTESVDPENKYDRSEDNVASVENKVANSDICDVESRNANEDVSKCKLQEAEDIFEEALSNNEDSCKDNFTDMVDNAGGEGLQPAAGASAWTHGSGDINDLNNDVGASKSMDNENTPGKGCDDAATLELTNNLLAAMSTMTPEVIANIVNANLAEQPRIIPPDSPDVSQDKLTER